MGKRFTDTNKYKKPFIRGLQGAYKLLWDFLYHDCDHAGIWIVDFEIAQSYIGKDMPVNAKHALTYFNDGEVRIIEIDNGKKWFIPSFIEFQYGQLTEKNRAHASVIQILLKHNLIDSSFKVKTNKPHTSPLQGGKDMDMDKELDTEKEKDKDPIDFSKPDIDGDSIVYPIDTPAVRDLWTTWKKYRWEVHAKRYGMMGEQADLKRLQNMDFNQIQSTILTAISSKWENLYPEKNGRKQRINGKQEQSNATADYLAKYYSDKAKQQ